jgi:hypothetical protein
MEIAMRAAAKKHRGRPRKHANTELITALIEKQDAMARRTYTRIEEILRSHVRVADVERLWRCIARRARAGLGTIPARAVARIATADQAGLRAFLEEEIERILSDADMGADDGAPLSELGPESGPPAVVRSWTLAEARAQSARLQSFLIDLRARIVPDWTPPAKPRSQP